MIDGRKLQRARIAAGMSLWDLGSKAGVIPQTISNFETGLTRSPTLATASKLATALGMTLEDLFFTNDSDAAFESFGPAGAGTGGEAAD